MGVLLPSRAYIREIETNETVQCGAYTLTKDTELSEPRVLLFKKGTAAGTEQLRLKVYSDSGYSDLLYTSEWSSLSDITDAAGAVTWWGWLKLAFSPRRNLAADTPYYLAVESSGYTRDGDLFYLALSLDWPVKQNSGDGRGVMIQIYGHREETI